MENTINGLSITDQQLQLVEKLGLMFETPGFQPAAARIMALLMVSDRVELTFDEIRETLQLSKSATSNAINLLLTVQKIDYITKPGDRKRYFRSVIAQWKDGMKDKFKEMEKLGNVMREVLEQRPASTPEFNKNFSEMISLMEYIFQEIPKLFKSWEENR